jgi:membrane fusion protein (multidrug efflux system)
MADVIGRAPDLERDQEGDAVEARDRSRADATPRQPPRRARQDLEPQSTGAGEPDGGATGEPPERTRWPLIALAVLIVIGVIGGTFYWYLTKDEVSTTDAFTDGRAVMVSPHVAGYVTKLAVNDNQFVHKGDLLVEIEPRDYLAAQDQAEGQLKALEAQLDNARLAVAKARVVYPAQLAEAEGQLRQAQGQLFNNQRQFARQQSLSDLATTQANRDTANSGYQSAAGQTQQAEAQVAQAKLVRQNIAQAETQVRQLEGQVEEARGSLEQAQINLGYTRIVAPQDGWVTMRNVEVGYYLQPGQQIMAVVVPQLWVTANFKETALARMHPGQKVRIHVDSYPKLKLRGHVDSIQRGSGSRFSAFPPENATGNFVKIVQRVPVKIDIDSGLDPKRPLPLGVSVEPTVLLK